MTSTQRRARAYLVPHLPHPTRGPTHSPTHAPPILQHADDRRRRDLATSLPMPIRLPSLPTAVHANNASHSNYITSVMILPSARSNSVWAKRSNVRRVTVEPGQVLQLSHGTQSSDEISDWDFRTAPTTPHWQVSDQAIATPLAATAPQSAPCHSVRSARHSISTARDGLGAHRQDTLSRRCRLPTLQCASATPADSHTAARRHCSTHPLVQYASTVLPSPLPCRSPAISGSFPKAASRSPASLTLATRLGTAASVVGSRMTPRRLVCLAKLTASRTLRHRLSGSEPGTRGVRCAPPSWCLSRPQ